MVSGSTNRPGPSGAPDGASGLGRPAWTGRRRCSGSMLAMGSRAAGLLTACLGTVEAVLTIAASNCSSPSPPPQPDHSAPRPFRRGRNDVVAGGRAKQLAPCSACAIIKAWKALRTSVSLTGGSSVAPSGRASAPPSRYAGRAYHASCSETLETSLPGRPSSDGFGARVNRRKLSARAFYDSSAG